MGVASMTGFARSEGDECEVSWAWEMKSVNGRSLDVRLRLPPGFDVIEPRLRSEAAARFRRGNIAATLTVSRTAAPSIRVNRDMLGKLLALANELTSEVEAAPPRLDGLLALRGVVEIVEDEPEAVLAARQEAVLRGSLTALDRLAEARAGEGARLVETLRGQLAELRGLVDAAAASAAVQPQAIRQRLDESLAALTGVVPPLPEERIAQELALLATRADVREELDRLAAHLEQAGELLGKDEPVGRQLDFLCQELNREANTLCSKSADIDLTRIGLSLKLAIEQFREQVQNLE